MFENQTVVEFCSFCMRNQAGGQITVPSDGVVLPVCDECMGNKDEMIVPVLVELEE